jgi:hypothetical protein
MTEVRHHERMRSDPHFRDFKARLPRFARNDWFFIF